LIETIDDLIEAPAEQKDARGTRYTPQEIVQQPTSWRGTFERFDQHRSGLRQFLKGSGFEGRGASNNFVVYLIGAGTSDYTGRALTYLLRREWGCDVWAIASTELLTNLDDYIAPDRNYLWISFSRSGDSSEGLALLETAIQDYPRIRHLLVTCNANSGMAQVCAHAPGRAAMFVLDETVNDRGLAMTSSYTNMLVAGQCLAHIDSFSAYYETLNALSEAGSRFLNQVQQCAPLLVQRGFSQTCFVGSGALHAAAQESALKVLELTAGRVQTMSESTLGIRHGPLSALHEETLFVSFLSSDPRRRRYEKDMVAEIKQKQLGKMRVVVSPDSEGDLIGLADQVLTLGAPGLEDEYRPAVDVMLAQSLGLFSSLKLGLKPDSPSPNGAISRVVNHVSIYR
jgi:tagatose-6-phosphate ketose/aldose isomerase